MSSSMLGRIPWVWDWAWQLGTIGEWVGGLGAVAALGTAFVIQRRDHRREDEQRRRAEGLAILPELHRGVRFELVVIDHVLELTCVNTSRWLVTVEAVTIRSMNWDHEHTFADVESVACFPSPHSERVFSSGLPEWWSRVSDADLLVHATAATHDVYFRQPPGATGSHVSLETWTHPKPLTMPICED